MELALNLAWFIIAVASYALLVRHLANLGAGHACGPSRCHCIVALSCVLAILFPVISLTDDLHEMQAAVEEPSSSCVVMKRCGVNHPLAPISSSHQLPYIVSSTRTDVSWVVFGNIVIQRMAHPSLGLSLTTFGRAPPSFVIAQIS
jgi:lysylphosphatidylglycerol synthetase-like protein (DUF2156 family)